VELKGRINDRNEIRRQLTGCDIGVEPAPANPLNLHSTFIKVMEYMAAAKPVVAFDLVETRYSLGDGGILVPSGDVQGYARAIARLLDDAALREEMGSNGYRRVSNELTWGKAADTLKTAYRSIGF
jgi:glycosyltransferase involved in cell wall biosynthesis